MLSLFIHRFKNTHRKKASSNKTPALRKSIKVDIWVVGILNQHSILEALKPKQNFPKNKVVTRKTAFFVIGPLGAHHSISFNIGVTRQFCMEMTLFQS